MDGVRPKDLLATQIIIILYGRHTPCVQQLLLLTIPFVTCTKNNAPTHDNIVNYNNIMYNSILYIRYKPCQLQSQIDSCSVLALKGRYYSNIRKPA